MAGVVPEWLVIVAVIVGSNGGGSGSGNNAKATRVMAVMWW
jgi:hypothetical protein